VSNVKPGTKSPPQKRVKFKSGKKERKDKWTGNWVGVHDFKIDLSRR